MAVRRARTVLCMFVLLAACAITLAPAALADGDPASDILVSRSIFEGVGTKTTAQQRAKLQALVTYVSTHGFPLKIALVPTAADLGSYSQLWEDASDYAGKYLGKELSLIYHGNLLVVMPEHYGLSVPEKVPPLSDQRVMDGNLATPGSDLVGSTINVVEKLAAANGITLPKRLAISMQKTSPSSISLGPVIGFIVGLVIIAAAWGISFRARPLRSKALA
jgi:hypothetical protein